MTTTRVWNITDKADSKVLPTTLVVLGKALAPGRSIQVEESTLELAHKLHREVKAGLVHIGKEQPAHQSRAHAIIANTVTKSHSGVPIDSIKSDAPAVVEDKLSETVDDGTEKSNRKGRKHWESR